LSPSVAVLTHPLEPTSILLFSLTPWSQPPARCTLHTDPACSVPGLRPRFAQTTRSPRACTDLRDTKKKSHALLCSRQTTPPAYDVVPERRCSHSPPGANLHFVVLTHPLEPTSILLFSLTPWSQPPARCTLHTDPASSVPGFHPRLARPMTYCR
jgi:hypothetical protein